MIESILIQIFTPLLINPAFPDSGGAYRSGIEDSAKSYQSDRPDTTHPMLRIDTELYDSEMNFIEPGIYAVEVILEQKKIFIMQGTKVLAKSPIIQIIRLKEEQTAAVPTAEIGFSDGDKVFLIYKNKNLEIHGFLYKPEIPQLD